MLVRPALALCGALLGAPISAGAQTAPVAPVGKAAIKPKFEQRREGAFQPVAAPALLVGRGLMPRAADALRPLTERLGADYGAAGVLSSVSGKLPTTPYILVGLEGDHPALRAL